MWSVAHLACWLSMKLPHGWRQPIHIADAGGRGPVDSRAAIPGTSDGLLSGCSDALVCKPDAACAWLALQEDSAIGNFCRNGCGVHLLPAMTQTTKPTRENFDQGDVQPRCDNSFCLATLGTDQITRSGVGAAYSHSPSGAAVRFEPNDIDHISVMCI